MNAVTDGTCLVIRFALLCAVLAAVPGAHAQKMPSVMFQSEHTDITGTPRAPLDFEVSPCTQLARDADALRGKPQRRMAAEQRYRAECVFDRQPRSTFGSTGLGATLGVQ